MKRPLVRASLFILGSLLVLYALADHPFYGGEPGFQRTEGLIACLGAGLAVCGLLPMGLAERVLLLAISSAAMLAGAETAAEWLLGPRYRPIYQTDDRLIFKPIPGRAQVYTRTAANGGETVTHRINTHGFRGDELRPRGETTRIVVYGDSFIHAYYTSDERTFPARLGVELASRVGRSVEVVNAGVSAYGPDQISLKMEDELAKLRPDLAVVAIFAGNDYGDLLRNKIFRLGPSGELLENRWTLDPTIRMRFDIAQRESILKRALRGGIDTAQRGSYRYEGPDMEFLVAEAQREYESYLQDDVVRNTLTDYYSADVSLAPRSASAQYKIRLMESVLRRIQRVAAKNGVPLAYLFIPHPSNVSDHYDLWRVDRGRFPDYDPRQQTAALERMARAMRVPFLNLDDVFRLHDANAIYFHGGDDHWNDAGQSIAARAMTEFILTRGLLSRTSAGTSLKPQVSGR